MNLEKCRKNIRDMVDDSKRKASFNMTNKIEVSAVAEEVLAHPDMGPELFPDYRKQLEKNQRHVMNALN